MPDPSPTWTPEQIAAFDAVHPVQAVIVGNTLEYERVGEWSERRDEEDER